MLEFIYSLDSILLGLFCLWVGYGLVWGVHNIILKVVLIFSNRVGTQHIVGQVSDIIYVTVTIYFTILYFKQPLDTVFNLTYCIS